MDAITSTAQFISSEDFKDKDKCLEFLTAHGKGAGAEGCPLPILQAIIKGLEEEIDVKFSELSAKETAKAKWQEKWKCEEEDTFQDYKSLTALTKPLEIDGFEAKEIKTGRYLKITNPRVIREVCAHLTSLKEEMEKELVSKTKPKKKGTRAKKADSEYEIKTLHEDKPPQGSEYDYYLAHGELDDTGATMKKDGKIIRVGAKGNENGTKDIKTQRLKAVKKEMPFLDKDTCDAAITWDRAQGSKVLEGMGIKGAFVMCCSNAVEAGGKCDRHHGKKSIFDGVYKTGKLAKVPYAQFLWECNEYGDVVGEDVDEAWVKSKVGSKWVDGRE